MAWYEALLYLHSSEGYTDWDIANPVNKETAEAKKMQLEIFRIILGMGANINATLNYDRNQTVLHMVCEMSSSPNLELWTLLLDKGANVKVIDTCHRTPLSCAVMGVNFDLVKALLAVGAIASIADPKGNTSLHYAVENRPDVSIVSLLLNHHGTPISLDCKRGENALHCATKCRHFTCSRQSFEVIALLLEKGIDINAQSEDGLKALHLAVQAPHDEELVSMLIKNHVVVTPSSQKSPSPLNMAISKNYLIIVVILLDTGADIEACSEDGRTLLLHAAETVSCVDFDPAIMREILSRGANIEAKHKSGKGFVDILKEQECEVMFDEEGEVLRFRYY